LNDKQRLEAIAEAIIGVASDTVIPREDEELFGILFAEHLLMNGAAEVDPDLLILSMRDALHELRHWKKCNTNAKIENVFTKEYIEELIAKGWYKDKTHDPALQ
jgi:hypothetical protein